MCSKKQTAPLQPDMTCSFEVLPSVSSKAAADSTMHHMYTDRSQEKPSLIDPQYWQKIKASPTSPFPVKVYNMLEQVEQDGYQHIVSWQPHGRCFLIHKPKEFLSIILPKYMSLDKFASFQRQLNLYEFGRITLGRDKGAYYHEYLLRGKGPLALEAQRIKVKGTCVRRKANPDEEPNFWALPWLHSSNGDDTVLEKTALGTSHRLPLLHPPSNILIDLGQELLQEPFKVESCANFQPSFRDVSGQPCELLAPTRRPRNDQTSAATSVQRQSVLTQNQIVPANSNCQNRSALCDTTEASKNWEMALEPFHFQPLSESVSLSRGECDILDLLTGPLGNDLFGQHGDIEPLSPRVASNEEIFPDKTDLGDMPE